MIEAITSFLGTILYPLFNVIFSIIDILQGIFGAFAGIDDIVYNGQTITGGNTGLETDTGIVYFLLTSETVLNIFFSMLALAIILLLIFLVMAFIRNVYSAQTKNWKEIVGLAIKGIGNFIIIPVGALLGIWLGNIVLQAINGATASGNSVTISRQLFVCAAYNANHLRGEEYQNVTLSSDDPIIEEVRAFCAQYGVVVDTSQTNPDYYADCIDQAYATGGPPIAFWWEADDWYSLWEINYLILGAGGIFIMYVLGALSFGMVKRLFMLLLLFTISPIVCSMYPIDNGSAAGNWRKTFLRQTISAYSAVAGVNLFFALLPIIQNIEFSGAAVAFDWMGLTSLLLLIAGLFMVKEFISVVNSFVGADDAYSAGTGLMASVGGRVRKGMGHVTNLAKKTGGAFGKATAEWRKGGGVKSFFSSLGKSAVGGLIGKEDKDGKHQGGLLQGLVNKTMGVDINSIINETKGQYEGVKRKDVLAEVDARNARKELKQIETRADPNDPNKTTYVRVTGKDKVGNPIETPISEEEINDLIRRAGVSDRAAKKYAKVLGVKREDYDNSVKLKEAAEKAGSKYDKAVATFNEMKVQSTLKVDGLDVANMSVDEFAALQTRMENNEMYSGNDLSIDAIVAQKTDEYMKRYGSLRPGDEDSIRRASEELLARRRAENRAVEQYQSAKQDVKATKDAFVEAAKAAGKDDQTGLISIDNKSIEAWSKKVEDALSKNQAVESVQNTNLLDGLKELTKTVDDAIGKKLQKIVKDAEKKEQKRNEKNNNP